VRIVSKCREDLLKNVLLTQIGQPVGSTGALAAREFSVVLGLSSYSERASSTKLVTSLEEMPGHPDHGVVLP
jgi:hypothetical protein